MIAKSGTKNDKSVPLQDIYQSWD